MQVTCIKADMMRYLSKNSFFVLFLCIVLALSAVIYRNGKKKKAENFSFLKHETLLDFIDEEKLLSKLRQELPQWMQEQVDEDFLDVLETGISKEQVDATFAEIKKNYPHPWIVHYRIVNNQLYRYFPKDQLIGTVNCGTEKAIKTLMRYITFKDMDFILSYVDGIPVPGMAADIHLTSSKQLQAPVLFSAKMKNISNVVLIPDWRSISQWWAKDITHILSKMQNTYWDKKKNTAIWRGGLTKPIRLAFCRLSFLHPETLNAKINVAEQDVVLQQQIEQEGLFGSWISFDTFLEHKYLPLLDGVCCAAPAFQWRLLSNSLTIKQESDEIQWFYRAVKPYVHYVPMKNDLSNFFEQIEWAKSHDALCKEISENATAFALNNLMLEDVYIYFYHVLKRYASLQTLDRKQLEKEIKADPRWVNIQNLRKLSKRVKKEKLKGYQHAINNP